MHSTLATCVQFVNNLGKNTGVTSVRLSTISNLSLSIPRSLWVKPHNITHKTHPSSTIPSTAFFAHTPLFEHYLYPVSTGPITTITNF